MALDQVFTAAEAAQIRDSMPALSDRPPGTDIVQRIEDFKDAVQDEIDAAIVAGVSSDAAITALAKMLSGVAVVLSGAATVTVTVASGFQGKPLVATLNEADAAIVVKSVVWTAATTFVITLSANATADRDVGWMMDGR